MPELGAGGRNAVGNVGGVADALPGQPSPLGATPRDGGTNFAVASGIAEGVEVCLFDGAGADTRIRLPAYDDGVWHGFVPEAGPGQAYGYRPRQAWQTDIDSYHGRTPATAGAAPRCRAGDRVTVGPRSVSVLRGLGGLGNIRGRRPAGPGEFAVAGRRDPDPGRQPVAGHGLVSHRVDLGRGHDHHHDGRRQHQQAGRAGEPRRPRA